MSSYVIPDETLQKIARLERIKTAADLGEVMTVFEFIGDGWRYIGGVPDDWRPGDLPVLVAGWNAIIRVYETAPTVISSDEEMELLHTCVSLQCDHMRNARITVEEPELIVIKPVIPMSAA